MTNPVPLDLETAKRTLSDAAAARNAETRVEERLEEIQAVLDENLAHVEAELARIAQLGPEPARLAAAQLVAQGGKRIRPVAVLLCHGCFGAPTAATRELAAVAELIHSATLLHDDVIDEGMERRGAWTARRLWGNGMSVLAGDLLLVAALEKTMEACPSAMPQVIETLRRLVEGEVRQMQVRRELDLSRATYDLILADKTASLFEFAARMGARLGDATSAQTAALERFGYELGMAFQLVDDVLDYDGAKSGKALFTDLCEGKLTLPLVLTVGQRPELVELVGRIHQGDREPVAELAEAVLASGALDEVRAAAVAATGAARDALSQLPESPARTYLEALAEQLAARIR